MKLPDCILGILEKGHRGKRRAILRRDLLDELKKMYPELKDRTMREYYENLPVHGISTGLFVPGTDKEKNELIELCEKKIRAYAKKRKILKKYQIKTDPIQLELPHG